MLLPRRHPQPTPGSREETAARQRPAFLPSHLRAEWDAVCQGQHNLLLVGTSTATNEILVEMRPHLREPLQRYSPKAGRPVPQPVEGTLLLSGVARLDRKQQTQLLRWLEHFDQHSNVQVISMSSKPLFPLVKSGAFLVDLYYKLNVVLIDLIGSGSAGGHVPPPFV